MGDVAGKRAVMGVSIMESAGRRLGNRVVADRRGPQTSEGKRANGRSALTGRFHRAARAGTCADGSAPTGQSHREAGGREGEHARSLLTGGVYLSGDAGRAWPSLAGLGLMGCFWFYFF
jgi:hypothetical protein